MSDSLPNKENVDAARTASAGVAEAARRLLAEADAVLGNRASGVPADFVTRLFQRTDSEDLVRYAPAELAAIADATWRFIGQRLPGQPKIRIADFSFGNRSREVSIVEIVNDDMPFLVDSIMAALVEQGLEASLVTHPQFTVERDAAGTLTAIATGAVTRPGATRESLIQVHVDRIGDAAAEKAVTTALAETLADVRHAVEDWRAMLARVTAAIADFKNEPPALPVDEIAESLQFLEWLMDDNFTFLGMREYTFDATGETYAPVAGSSLGVLRERTGAAPEARRVLTPRAVAALDQRKLLLIAKSPSRSRVHRRAAMESIVIKRFDRDGKRIGGLQLVGLFTSTAYVRSTRAIPYIRRKVASILARAGFGPSSHSGKALANVLDTYPRDELFQIEEDTLYDFALTILELGERPRVRVLPRIDMFERYASVLVYVPRDRYDSTVRAAIADLLAAALHGRVASFTPFYPEAPIVRVHFVIARDGDEALANPSRAALEAGVAGLTKTWSDGLIEALAAAYDPAQARALFAAYGMAFSAAYREAFSPAAAVEDIAAIAMLSPMSPLGIDFRPSDGNDGRAATLKVWSYGAPIPLSQRVPMLEHMGFTVVDESTYHVVTSSARNGNHLWLHDMQLDCIAGITADIPAAKPRLDACLTAVMRAEAESDGYNALVLAAGLSWSEAALMRTLSRYLRQLNVPYSQSYMWATLVRHAGIAARIVALFRERFDPDPAVTNAQREARQAALSAEIDERLATVASLDEDRIIRHFVNAVQASLRTNFYQRESGRPKPVIAIKFDSRKVAAMPLPRPRYEIFLCSPRLEAVHLRFGPVARGGIRWSDRPQDFRTEVLGLVKAQQVKNAVIVPVGAKGGFVPKHLPPAGSGSRDAVQAEGIATYRLFMSTLLDLTDNLDLNGVVPPPRVVRHDGDDPYLVVAADKGTATFSDIANEIARQHRFWLDDAFASGGSQGYDHKRMGITARGAWESVKRHFREMNIDIAKRPFSVVGVGDMSGDVFGNGMLRERTIRLVAAFDHRDIFIDPDPDPARSFDERARLFALPRSSWQDFDRSVISPGGGVYARAAKEIELSPQAQAALGITAAKLTPQEVMSAILKAPVDLLWFGGIGTYVRGSMESDEEVGDRANDGMRITGAELRCKVVGEGANLGATQLGRIEAALRGIRLNTDAIDNSAGVNTSDLEVNLKIALSIPLRDGRLDATERGALLAGATDEVAALVLRNNYQQSLAISLAEQRGLEDLGFQQRLMQVLEHRQFLDRDVEFLPTDREMIERQRRAQPLTRPELAVLLAYAKLALHDELIGTSVPDDPYLARELNRYFPRSIANRFPDALAQHRLRRDIIATQLANSMINRGGPAFVVRIADQTGAGVDRIAAAFAAVRDSFALTALNTAIEELDNKVGGAVQLGLFVAVQNLLLDRIVWFLRNVDLGRGLAEIIDHYRAGIAAIAAGLDLLLPSEAQRSRAAAVATMVAAGVPEALASQIANLSALNAAPDIVLVADRAGRPVDQVAAIYFAAVAYFQLDRVAAAAADVKLIDYFDRLAYERAVDAIGDAIRRLVAEMTGFGRGADAVAAWVAHKGGVERVRAAVHEIAASGLTLSKLTVAASMLGDLARA